MIITEGQSRKEKIALVIANATGESFGKAKKRLTQFPVEIAFKTKIEAIRFVKEIFNVGGKATIKSS